jgi:CBS domain-containing protein
VMPKDEALQTLVLEYLARQRTGLPVHEWGPPEMPGRDRRRAAYQRVGQVMTTDLITVQEQDTVSLAEAMMRWENIRHVPVENEDGEFVGMFALQDLVQGLRKAKGGGSVTIGEIMDRNVAIVTPETPTLDAIQLMRKDGLSGLPVIRGGKLVGLVTEADFLVVVARLLE